MVTRDEMLAGLNLSGIQTPPRQIGRAEMLAGLQLGKSFVSTAMFQAHNNDRRWQRLLEADLL